MKSESLQKQDVWTECRERLRGRYPESLFTRFIEPLRIEYTPGTDHETATVSLIAPDETVRKHIEKKYLKDIQEELLLQNIKGQIHLRSFIPDEDRSVSVHTQEFHPHTENRNQVSLLYSLSFPGPLSAVWGPNGSGKTTLARSLEIRSGMNGKKTKRIPWSRFIEEFSNALSVKKIIAWKEKLRSLDLLIIDDFQILKQGSSRTQEELRFFIDDFGSGQGKIVIFSDIPFTEIPLSDSLRSRFGGAFTVRLFLPDADARFSVMQDALSQSLPDLSPQARTRISEYLASRIRDDGWKLQSAAHRLQLLSGSGYDALSDEQLYMRITDSACSELYSADTAGHDPEILLRTVADFYKVTPDSIRGPARDRKFTEARHVFAYLCYRHLNLKLVSIAVLIGRKDHTAVLHGVNKTEQKINEDLFFRSQIRKLAAEAGLL